MSAQTSASNSVGMFDLPIAAAASWLTPTVIAIISVAVTVHVINLIAGVCVCVCLCVYVCLCVCMHPTNPPTVIIFLRRSKLYPPASPWLTPLFVLAALFFSSTLPLNHRHQTQFPLPSYSSSLAAHLVYFPPQTTQRRKVSTMMIMRVSRIANVLISSLNATLYYAGRP